MPSVPNELSLLLKDLFAIRRLNRDNLNTRFSASLDVLERDPVATLELARQLRSLFYTPSLTDSGINSSLGFFPELRQRFRHRILPPINEDHFFRISYLKTLRAKEIMKGSKNYRTRIGAAYSDLWRAINNWRPNCVCSS